MDETDRLLRQSYQDWLPYLTTALEAQQRPLHQRVVKVVVSATLTRDPSKVERLGLHCPQYIAMTSQDHRSASALLYHFLCAAVVDRDFLPVFVAIWVEMVGLLCITVRELVHFLC